MTLGGLNKSLKELLWPVLGKAAEGLTGHSFRAAIPSALANRPDIAGADDIKAWGRWSSDSYLLYTRLKPLQKRLIYGKIVAALNLNA